jgi:hypothetical protein
MIERFYRFRPADEKDCLRIQASVKYDTLDLIRQDSPLTKSNDFTIAAGKYTNDIIQFDDSLNFAISKRLKLLLENNNVYGWSSFPINIKGLNEAYFAFQVISVAGPILNLDAVNNYETEFREFDINTWDGKEIFSLKDTLLNVCTERVKDMFMRSNITNIKIMPL